MLISRSRVVARMSEISLMLFSRVRVSAGVCSGDYQQLP